MRNLKKILALVLALMMVLSVMVTASASFDDADEITYFEAVDVLAAAGVLKGDGNGNFLPTAELDRASAAVLISNILLGTDVSLIEKTATSYKDVPATHWASGYVAYCSDMGIISGDGAGSYYPDVKLDGYSFAKMLLVANYPTEYIDKEGKVKFGGNSWKLQVAVALKDHPELLAGLDLTLSANLTREEAAQMMLNTMVDTGALKEEYGIDTQDVTVAGLNGYKWTQTVNGQTTDITDVIYTDTYVESFASGTTYADVMKALGITDTSTVAGVNYYNTVEGNTVKPADFVKSTDTVPQAYALDVYVNEAKTTYKFMYTIETLVQAKLGEEVTDKKDDNYGKYVWTFGDATVYEAKDAYEKDAYYLAVIANDTLLSAKLAEVVTGKVTSKGADYVRIDGTKYTYAKNVELPALGAEQTLYLATDKTVLKSEVYKEPDAVITSENLVYVIGYFSKYIPATTNSYDEYGNLVAGKDASWDRYIQVMTMDGEITNYLYDIGTTNTNYNSNIQYRLRVLSEPDKDGVYSISEPTLTKYVTLKGMEQTSVKYTDGTKNYYTTGAEVIGLVGTQTKVDFISNATLNTVDEATAVALYTGTDSNLTVSKIIYWVEKLDTEKPEEINPDEYHDMFIIATESTDSKLIETVNEKGETVDTTVWTHKVYLSGVETEILYKDAALPVSGVATYTVDEYGRYTIEAYEGSTVSGTVANLYGTLFTVGDGTIISDYDLTDVTVIDLSDKGDGDIDVGDTVTVIYNVDDKTTLANEFAVVVIYITASVEAK